MAYIDFEHKLLFLEKTFVHIMVVSTSVFITHADY